MESRISLLIFFLVRFLLIQGKDVEISNENITADTSRRVLFGEIANPADFRFVVRIYNGVDFCGGSVISDNFVLTAAHCIKNYECSSLKIFPSTWVDGIESRVQPVQCYVNEKFRHWFFYDIALIRTQDNLLENSDFGKIPLPAPGTHFPTGTRAVLVGWGKTDKRIFPDHLLRADALVWDWNTCDSNYRAAPLKCERQDDCSPPGIPRRGFCVRGNENSQPTATCHGDSGGPVIINGVVGGIVTAVINFEDECHVGSPSLNLNIADYLPWIYSIIEPNIDTSQMPVVEELL